MNRSTTTTQLRLIRIVLPTLLVVLVPALAMLVSDDISWGPLDFIAIACIMLTLGIASEIIDIKIQKQRSRIIARLLVALVLFAIWVELAAGIFH